jgi:hypothetical protein
MKHFALEDWADFMREVVEPLQRAAMQRHLDEGCKRCLRAVAVWQSVLDVARQEANNQPPESAVRAAKAYYGVYGPEERLSGAAKIAELIFDSIRQPLPAGVRASGVASRQLLYRLGRTLIDMRLEAGDKPNRISLVGQVLDSSQTDRGVSDIPVILLCGSESMAQTVTNQFGEFHLALDAAQELHLRIGKGEPEAILIPLRAVGLASDQTPGPDRTV